VQPARAIAALARRQHGVVARRQLLATGVSSGAIGRMMSSGWLRAVHRGVYRTTGAVTGPHARWMAAVLAGGREAMLSHRSAAELWKLLEPIDGPVHVTVPHGRSELVGLRFHWSRQVGERTTRAGIPVTTVPRTLLDLASSVSPTQLRHAFDEADRRGQLRRGAVARLCEQSSGRRGLGALRARLDERPIPVTQTRSRLEQRFLGYCRRRGLPIPAVNTPLAGYEVDCVWPDHRVAVEIDSWTHHTNRDAFESDRKRDTGTQLAGYRILRVTHRRMTDEGDELEAEIRRLLSDGD
jgi:very-short-patch-repair endonuclease/predicted transcriptional regulator of viral defense system